MEAWGLDVRRCPGRTITREQVELHVSGSADRCRDTAWGMRGARLLCTDKHAR